MGEDIQPIRSHVPLLFTFDTFPFERDMKGVRVRLNPGSDQHGLGKKQAGNRRCGMGVHHTRWKGMAMHPMHMPTGGLDNRTTP